MQSRVMMYLSLPEPAKHFLGGQEVFTQSSPASASLLVCSWSVLEMVSAGTSNKRPCFAVVPNGVSGFLFIAFAVKAQIRSTSLYLWKVG